MLAGGTKKADFAPIHADTSTENVQNAGVKRVIRATASPVPDHLPAQADAVYHVPINETTSTTHDGLQEDETQEEDDRFDVLHHITNSGILDWRPRESWTAKNTTAHGPQMDRDIHERSTAIEDGRMAEQEDDIQRNKLPRPRGRPPKKGISRRQSHICICIFM